MIRNQTTAKKLTLHPHQSALCLAPERYPALFGGIGNGKTAAACYLMLSLGTLTPDNLILIGRQTYPELRDSTREVFLSQLAQCYPQQAYEFNKSDNEVVLWNKSRFIFRHLDNPATILSMNLGAFYVDQAEEIDEEVYKTLQGRLRRSGVENHKGVITGNPRGNNWVYYRYGLDRAPAGFGLHPLEHAEHVHNVDYRMVSAPTASNAAHLPADYLASLMRSYTEEEIARYLVGSWASYSGQIWEIDKILGYEALPRMTSVVIGCDPAISQKSSACNSVLVCVGMGVDGRVYVIECVAGQWSFYDTLGELERLVKRVGDVHAIGVEDVAYQQALVEAATRYHPSIQVHNMRADRDKFRRAKAVSHIVSRGLLCCNDRELIAEMSAFHPDASSSVRNDRVDALVHALRLLQQYAPLPPVPPQPHAQAGYSAHQAFLQSSLREEWARVHQPEFEVLHFNADGAQFPIDSQNDKRHNVDADYY